VANYLFVRLVFRSPTAGRFLEGLPRVLVEHGRVLTSSLRKEAISEQELRSAALERGFGRLEDVDLMVLEPNGHLAIMKTETASEWRRVHGEEGEAKT
jgi:uncharacterized membrane protein YcaP (DUF421 family)